MNFTNRFKAATGLLPRAYRLRFSAKARTQVPWTARK